MTPEAWGAPRAEGPQQMIMRMLTLTTSPREFKQCVTKYIEPDAHIILIVYCIYI
jgi:hypothetical protein